MMKFDEPPRGGSLEECSKESYMNPRSDRPKYKGRDREIGEREAKRRLAILPKLEKISRDFCAKHSIENCPILIPKGSADVGMSTPESDFDVAVVVSSPHIFLQDPNVWRQYVSMLEVAADEDFRVELHLISRSESGLRFGTEFSNHISNAESDSGFGDLFKKFAEFKIGKADCIKDKNHGQDTSDTNSMG
ncbi:MAG: hypothetical protein HGB18_02335 [Candidatus Moranbacteria bacterium]|nr:hypothetical protein [Candidatus Moranbacteria bacterium]